jgi:hypothetical protein
MEVSGRARGAGPPQPRERTGMREITIEPESMEAALAWLDSADKEKRDAKLLKAKMADQSDYSVIQALQSLIAYARVHPYGKVACIMRKRKLMERIGLTCWVEEPEVTRLPGRE